MRLISWDGRRDVSYENCHLVINPKTFEIEAITGNTNFEPIMGIYSTEAKALKVMELLREQYQKLEVAKVIGCGCAERMSKDATKTVAEIIISEFEKAVTFRFPKDEDVEV